MSLIESFFYMLMHIDKYLNVIVQQYGVLTYGILFLIIFCETGLVVTPFLPGDSMLFVAGALSVGGSFNIGLLVIIIYLAAVLGDTSNYHIGKKLGTKLLEKEDLKYINKDYLIKAQGFYERHGSMTIVIGRFIPIIRTFVPFVAGIGEMKYSKFITYNLLGGFLWVGLFLGGGYLFGNLSIVKNNFSYVAIVIILISLVPAVVAVLNERRKGKSTSIDTEI